ncbi:MAG: peptide-methionine (S)-S-oxide reductase MsrA [Gemmatimonadetes bacterium]|nr:peptide-methionine (S)-S-oxide reductase MsrA [Gemmatimonadota bacterium]
MTQTEIATLGGGCFWCLEAVYAECRGVLGVKSGYAGGHVERPTYEQVCGKKTGHIEVVQVTFDPTQVSYRELLQVFFTIHDPTTMDRQGNDVGPQYRSAVFTQSDAQAATVREVMAELTAEGIFDGPIVTEIRPFTTFWPAEEEHDDYFARNPWNPYCSFVVAPKVAKFRKKFYGALATKA